MIASARRGRRWAGIALAVMAVAGVLTGCAEPEEPSDAARPVTTEESELLAVARFRNFDAGTRSIAFDVDDAGAHLRFDGWFDYAGGVGYGALTADDARHSLLLWNSAVIGTHAPVGGDPAPLPIADADALETAWKGSELDPGSSRLHAVLAVVGSLGVDRPDNPLLLRQGGALHLGEEDIDGTATTVFAGPVSDRALPAGEEPDPDEATTRYWVDAEGMLRRFATRLGGGGDWTTIDFGDAGGVSLGDPFSGAAQ